MTAAVRSLFVVEVEVEPVEGGNPDSIRAAVEGAIDKQVGEIEENLPSWAEGAIESIKVNWFRVTAARS